MDVQHVLDASFRVGFLLQVVEVLHQQITGTVCAGLNANGSTPYAPKTPRSMHTRRSIGSTRL
jgi:hypothetical protein